MCWQRRVEQFNPRFALKRGTGCDVQDTRGRAPKEGKEKRTNGACAVQMRVFEQVSS